MVPPDFVTFFATMAGVGATLFGLIFLVISIRPEVTQNRRASVLRQAQVASSYTALLNSLVISLFALFPHTTICTITCIMSAIGLINTILMGVSLFSATTDRLQKLRSLFFILTSLGLFGSEMLCALLLFQSPGDLGVFSHLTVLLIIIYLYGIARAWDLVGARQFHIQELFAPLLPRQMEELVTGKGHEESSGETSQQNNEAHH